uniref:Phosphatidylinositol-specific phospholipase C X domain-containing protein n=1 Tax=Capra hircus TaxID=9925 RepID=A0A8C2RGA2_CAPHI
MSLSISLFVSVSLSLELFSPLHHPILISLGQKSAVSRFSEPRLHTTSTESSANADWISVLSSRLWDMPLHHLSIPGSHSTMTYCLHKKSPISHKEWRLLKLLDKVLPCVTLPVVLKWSATQVRVCGHARALDPDLQMAHMEEGTKSNLHSGHMVYTMALLPNPTQDMLTEISEWLENHPQEEVTLACRNLEGMMEDLHEYLKCCIKNIFGDMLCKVPTLHQLWSQGQQVILSYKDKTSMSQHAELWPSIPYWWGNQVEPQDFVHCLECMKSCSHPGELLVAGINLTENLEFSFILVHPAWSLQKLTLSGLPYLCAWVRAQCPGSAAGCTNIIAGDFIGASGFVSDVIGLNRKLLRG